MIAHIGSVIGNIDHPILANQEIRRDPVGGPFHAARKHAGFHRTGCIQQNGRRQHRSPPLLYAVAAIQLHAWVCNDRKWCILTPNMRCNRRGGGLEHRNQDQSISGSDAVAALMWPPSAPQEAPPLPLIADPDGYRLNWFSIQARVDMIRSLVLRY